MGLPVLNDSICNRCTGLCCTYVTVEIDKPRSKRAKDDARWYLLHAGVTIIVEDGNWHVKFPSRCDMLDDDNSCKIYDDRPKTCREYSNDNCDYYSEYEGWERNYIELETAEDLANYFESRKRKKNGKAKKAEKKK